MQTKEPVATILAHAVEEYRRSQFWAEANAAWTALRADPHAWQDELDERAMWDATMMDDLEAD